MIASPTLTALDWDGWPARYAALQSRIHRTIDLTDLARASRIWASTSTAQKIKARLPAASATAPNITLAGSGDFHHVTLLLLELAARPDRPLSLVMFDNHPDWFSHRPRHHCGNWLWSAARLPGIIDITLIGPTARDLKWYSFYFAPMNHLRTGRVRLVPFNVPTVHVPGRGVFRFETIGADENAIPRALDRLRGRDVYVSIDKDCLGEREAVTDWDAGRLTLTQVTDALTRLTAQSRLVGADIIGDRSPEPLRGLLRRIDAGRWRRRTALSERDVAINVRSTVALLQAMGVPGEACDL
ncbi:MAG: hypothetical protein ACTHLZ_08095 [Tepidisphaeraceae bacterium]